MNRRFHGIRSRRALLRSGWIAAWIAACIALPILIGACLLADEGSGEEQDLAQSEPSHHDDGPDPFEIAERLGIDPAEAAWVQMREKHYFHSLEDMVAVADTVVVGRVVGLEEGRVLVPDDDYGQPAFETAIAEIEVERAMLGAAEGEILEVEFERWIFETEDDGSVSRYRMIRSDLANEYEVGERGIYALGRFDEGGRSRV